MAVKDFDFTTHKTKEMSEQQAIVFVQDELDSNMLIKYLKSAGIRVIGSGNREADAMEYVRKYKSGLFFLDFDIAALGSNEILEKLNIQYPKMKTIVIANKMNKEQVNYARKQGVLGFLAKPVTTGAVKKILSKI